MLNNLSAVNILRLFIHRIWRERSRRERREREREREKDRGQGDSESDKLIEREIE